MNSSDFASLEELKGAKISVFGLGVSGLSVCRLLNACEAELTIVNQQPDDSIKCHSFLLQDDQEAAQKLAQSELIILSPGIPRTHPVLNLAHQNKVRVWNEVELGFRLLKKISPQTKWLAITGTNGKTTTVSMLGQMLEVDGRGVFVGGNIGTPLCDLLTKIKLEQMSANDFPATVVLELSSFQLESLDIFRPHGAAILNITASHGERYETVGEYANAKTNIVKMLGAGDLFLSQKDDSWTEKVVKAGSWLWERIDPQHLNLKNYDLSNFSPFGLHNLMNLDFAARLASHVGASEQAIQQTIDEFKPVAHRLETVFEREETLILNDSKSTNWASTLAALRAVKSDEKWGSAEVTLVIGGKCRGHHDFPSSETIDLLTRAQVRIIAFGEFAQNFKAEIQKSFSEALVVDRLEDIFGGWNQKGILLFSPAFPSFDAFKSYADRGEKFKSLVQAS